MVRRSRDCDVLRWMTVELGRGTSTLDNGRRTIKQYLAKEGARDGKTIVDGAGSRTGSRRQQEDETQMLILAANGTISSGNGERNAALIPDGVNTLNSAN